MQQKIQKRLGNLKDEAGEGVQGLYGVRITEEESEIRMDGRSGGSIIAPKPNMEIQ